MIRSAWITTETDVCTSTSDVNVSIPDSVPVVITKALLEVAVTKNVVVTLRVIVMTSHDVHPDTLELLLLLVLLLLTSLQMVYHRPAERYDVCPGQGLELDDDIEERDDITDGDEDGDEEDDEEDDEDRDEEELDVGREELELEDDGEDVTQVVLTTLPPSPLVVEIVL